MALRVLNISQEQAIAHFINTFTEPVDGLTSLEQFKADVEEYNNDELGNALNLPDITPDTQLYQIVESIFEQTNKYATLIGFGTYILNNDLDDTWEKLKQFFRGLLPDDIEAYVKDILIPKFRATLLLTAAIEFPRSILKPVYPEEFPETDGNEDLEVIPPVDDQGNPKVLLSFGQALFYADSQKGFGYNMDIILNTSTPAQIGNTGLIIDIHNLKIDISRTENIIEADLDNRPPEFMGVYMERTDIFLPKKWFKKDTGQTLAITGERLLIGTGGMSGSIALRATYAKDEAGQVTDYFSDFFEFNYPITVISNGTPEPINQGELVSHINTLQSPYDLKFKFPLSITSNGTVFNFENEADYYSFINAIDPNQFMWFKLGKNPDKAWRIGFDRFDLLFHHGEVVESNLHAQLVIPKLRRRNGETNDNGETIIDLVGHWNNEENFNLTAAFLPTGLDFTLFNFVTINMLSAEVGRQDDNFYIGTSCEIWFENAIMDKILDGQKIVIPHLRIYDNGTMEIVGGTGFIPTNISLNLGPIEIAVTGIHFGSHQQEHNGVMRKYNYWGFDGAISLDPLGIDARGEGIKYYYTIDNDEHDGNGDTFLRIQTIEVDLVIPGTASPESAIAIIHGMVSIPEPGVSPEYIGEVSLKLPKAKIAGGAAMRLQPKHPAFLIDAHIDLPAPIPLGPLGIYGFRGLLGFRYVAEKEAVGLVSGEDTWYDYYTYPPKGVHISKFSGPERTADYDMPISIGAGAVLGTSFDSGTILSMRMMMLLSMPTMFLLDGKASILSARLGLDDNREPPFFFFTILGDNSLEFGMGADFQLPQNNGWILDLYAEVQAGFFFNNPRAWYVNFGTRDVPITARVLTIITAQSYLMLSATGIEAGARVEFDLRKRFGPAKVHIYAYLEMGGFVSFERPQIGGYIALGGMIDVDIWIVSLTIGLDAIFSVEAAKPFLIYAELRLRACIRIRLIIKTITICKSFTVKLKWEKNKQVDRTPIPALPYQNGEHHADRTKELVQAVHMLTNDSFEVNYLGVNISGTPNASQITKIIPLDTYIDIKTVKGLIPGAVSGKIGGHTGGADNFTDLIPPQRVVRGGRELRQVKHKYSIEDIEIKAWTGSNWMDYHPFEAVVKQEDRNQVDHLRIGYWQRTGNQYDAIRLLATNPFSYTEAGEPGWMIPEQYGITPSELFCQSIRKDFDCANVLNKVLGTTYYPPTQYTGHFINGAYFTLDGHYETTVTINPDGTQNVTVNEDNFRVTNTPNNFGFNKSLEFDNGNSLVIILQEPSVEVKLKLTTHAEGVTIRYYKSTGVVNYNAVYEEIHEDYKTASQLQQEVYYTNETDYYIAKIVIEPQLAMNKNQKFNDLENDPCKDKDEELCEIYERLFLLYQQCFVPVQTNEDVDSNIDCFQEFRRIIKFEIANGPFPELVVTSPLYEEYIDVFIPIVDNQDSESQLIRFYELKRIAEQILDLINENGKCDCNEDKFNVTSLQEICWMTLENYEFNLTIPGQDAVEQEQQDMVDAIQKTVQPIWRPNTKYYVRFRLKDDVDNGENEGLFDYYYGFKTVGPVGHYHKHSSVDYVPANANPDQYPLTSLRQYIDYNRSYPNADGNLLQAKPLFYGHNQCKITVYFSKPLTYHMLNKWHKYEDSDSSNFLPELAGSMHIAIKDPVTEAIIPYPLPVGYSEDTVPVSDTFATWLEFDSSQDLSTLPNPISLPQSITIIDNTGQEVDTHNVLKWEYLHVSNKYHVRIDDEALLSGNNNLIGGKIIWNNDGTDIEFEIIAIGTEDATWNVDNDPRIPMHLQLLNNMIDHINANSDAIECELTLGDPIVPNSYAYTVTLTNLKPRKLYTALLYNAFDKNSNGSLQDTESEEVHQFVFQTSRYQNFEAQVKSYWLRELDNDGAILNERQAVFEIPLSLSTAEINTAYNIVAGVSDASSNALELQYYHLFDRATEGVLGFNPVDPPENTEFNVLKDDNTGKVIGILIRNPEPFNIPKIPLEEIEGSIAVVFASSGNINNAYKVLYSKDYSQALIMHTSKEITDDTLNLRFQYKTWNGTSYEVSDTVVIENIQLTQ